MHSEHPFPSEGHPAPAPSADRAVAQGPVAGIAAPVSADAAVPESTALSLRGLRKSFDGTEVVHELSLDVPRGSFYGIVGPNGAGKTTTLSMATGLLRPDGGTAHVLGHDMWAVPEQAKARLGVLADGLRTFDRLTGRELLTYVGLVRGMEPAVVEERMESLLTALDLAGEDGKLVVDYSAGMTKKILLACALLHAPRLLVLDEPLEAVDPVSAQVIRKILTAYVDGGGTVVLSSHVMELVEGLCSHVAIIARGELLADGTLDQVRQGGSLVQTFIDLVGGGDVAEGSLAWLES
ncbi:ATP-binding transport protein NatA [Brachybacterium faecium]|uniref:ABC-type multidrug transport system, ATPase component n=1 Tax=Brachybacterium faecium (strain ATCC 43885 / DSM 4810 / JCM 11609 / LMG 19847 / NBRC 14762 / NCIMB 9860 / 6-10) TaxID=446465 RepID=C7MEV4_BRAFD|nr:ABC transporter ATP-binding protein [Brachybacterium faecium]ACU86104.1 ABC-type multidrug transport system, ATPase component [Brachybacterium faecium DSM 4810]SLM94997.1 ATP-binding transport protein NatA [Brachybacterium faecium]HJG51790.1 ABC transporter ATP-binding protein [Brachybacterium faecium]